MTAGTAPSTQAAMRDTAGVAARVLLLLAVAAGGLALVKWMPYYHKAVLASGTHSLGPSILSGGAQEIPAPSFHAALDYALAYGKAIWKALLLGLLLGSGIQALLPRRWIETHLGGRNLGTVLLAGALSLPGMMCTCCAAPVVAGLRRCAAAPGSAVAFWLGNTVLNPATLAFTGFVLGWRWTALRLALGVVMVFGLGWLVNRLAAPGESVAVSRLPAGPVPEQETRGPLWRWLREFARLSVRLLPEFVVLVLALGAARAWLFPHLGPEVGNSLGWIVAFALAGAIFVIPTAGEVPIVQALLALGVGAGPAAALLMTLPPISAPSAAMLWGSFRARTFAVVAAGVVLLGCIAGILARVWLA